MNDENMKSSIKILCCVVAVVILEWLQLLKVQYIMVIHGGMVPLVMTPENLYRCINGCA